MTDFLYVGIGKCGHAVAAVCEDDENLESTAQDVAEMIRLGYAVERIERKEFSLKACRCQ